ncbi:aldo/keto reductase [Blastopirellula marina]|uniref:4-dihydromethyl-trisporate dehydrogenase n=1 Tax=Blastopirellula marina TaxID=124 RepID=A0A2S8GKJ3_9BACT|nr:aldo/keto reductase [Blastopirellula marina]PQO44900.1 4-dihydromethyl-trisporate dehydrogenase [Blastopirellula marina]
MSSIPAVTLNTGAQMPQLGLGTWKIDKTTCPEVIVTAAKAGYRHFDCACDYGNEVEVGQGIQRVIDEGIATREELWITSKLWNTYHAAEHVQPALEKTLSDLGLGYVDLYLIHFPIALKFVPFEERYPPEWVYDPKAEHPGMIAESIPIRETWEAMERLVEASLAKNIGVCNFNVALIRDLLNYASVRPSVLQVELHPLLTQEKLLRYCESEEIAVTAFSSFGAESYYALGMAQPTESLIKHDVVTNIANACGKSPGQVLLRWGVQRGTIVIPKSSSEGHLKENAAIFDFELTAEQMSQLSALNIDRRFNDPGDFCEAAFNTFFPIYD